MNVHSLRAFAAFGIAVSMLAAACQAGTGTSSPSASATPGASTAEPSPALLPTVAAPTAPAVASPTATAQPSPLETPIPSASAPAASTAPEGPWVTAGSLGEFHPAAVVPLGNGGVLAIDAEGRARRGDPAAGSWWPAVPLNAPREDFAAVTLRDGRVLVTGGLDTHDWDRWQAYSSTYVYDPSTAVGSWTKVGLLGTARVAPAAAVLPDGRVLVAGGAYKDGPRYDDTGSSGITLASSTSRGPGSATGGGGRFDDMAPPSIGVALATAELFDPTTGRWSPTGSMRFARARAVAVTLSDGRVLVVGAAGESGSVQMDPRAFDSAEVYDPATGHFSLVASLPPIDRAAIAEAGVDVSPDDPWMTSTGTLVALPDGGAFLVGHSDEWKHEGYVTRTFRYDARSGNWRQVGKASAGFTHWDRGTRDQTPGTDLSGAYAAALRDGRVLVAGGVTLDNPDQVERSRVAYLYDPATDTWARLPSMPEGRQGWPRGLTVALADGSILLVGGSSADGETAVRFVPSP